MDSALQTELSADVLQLVTAEQAWHYAIIPHFAKNGTIGFYIDKTKPEAETREELEILLGKDVELTAIASEVVLQLLGTHYRRNQKRNEQQAKNLSFSANSDDFLPQLILNAYNVGSSDIHIEIYEDRCRVRMRIDGKMIERFVLKKEDYPAIINRIKIKANLDIAEKRLPQDGRIFFVNGSSKFDIRVSVLPTLYGEKVVMRLLNKDATDIDIHKLGFNTTQLTHFLEAVRKPHGIMLISGPTGSGKTTTLYATLRILNKEHTNILTIEDPIEYTLEGINQVQLKESIGLSFASALRTFLRQDPDVIMLGEIRDSETAQMAMRAALTGHLVLSTIHTNSAWGTISRLIDMDVPAFLIANTLNLSVAQRLVRVLCPHCKKTSPDFENQYPLHYKPEKELVYHYIPVGCEQCYYTGFRGRRAVYEVIPIDAEIIDYIKSGNMHSTKILKKKNIKTLSQSAFELIESGESSIEECYSILMNQE